MSKIIKPILRIVFIVAIVVTILNIPTIISNVHNSEKQSGPTLQELLKEAKVSTAIGGTSSNSTNSNNSLLELQESTGIDFGVTATEEEVSQELPYDTVTLVRVVDGDTICVDYGDHFDTSVRFIGCNTPESVNPNGGNTQEGVEASLYTKHLLTEGMTLYLTYDVEKLDKYGRTLAYVWLQPPTEDENIEYIKENMLNAILIADGYAEVMIIEPNTKYQHIFQEL